jgi:hypothetical protein
MAKNKSTNSMWKWSDEERQQFADGVRLRASRIPNKKRVAARKACRRFNID